MKLSRLRGRKICEQLLRKGHLWKGKHLWIRWSATAPRHPAVDPARPGIYVGTVASTKLDTSAVKRNRMRRRSREALRIAILPLPEELTAQLLIIPRSSSLTCAFPELAEDIRAFLQVLRSWQRPKNPGNSSSSR